MNKMFLFGLHIKSCFYNWKLIAKEVGISLFMWYGYLMVTDMATGMNVDGLVKACFWLAVFSSGTSLLTASLRSILPALFAWLLIAPMYFLGLSYAMNVTLFIANTALIIHMVSYAFLGDRFIRI